MERLAHNVKSQVPKVPDDILPRLHFARAANASRKGNRLDVLISPACVKIGVLKIGVHSDARKRRPKRVRSWVASLRSVCAMLCNSVGAVDKS